MKQIQLNKSLVTQVDDEDFSKCLALGRWSASENTGGAIYAYRKEQGRTLALHRFVMGLGRDDQRVVDHINGDGLDNRKCNLRICSKLENGFNKKRRQGTKAGYKGINQQKSGRWSAKLCRAGQTICLGTFDTPEQAAKAYDEGARKYYGDFARLNFEVVS